MIFYKIKSKISDVFFSEEPDWHWGAFQILFFVITIDYILNKNFFRIRLPFVFPSAII